MRNSKPEKEQLRDFSRFTVQPLLHISIKLETPAQTYDTI